MGVRQRMTAEVAEVARGIEVAGVGQVAGVVEVTQLSGERRTRR